MRGKEGQRVPHCTACPTAQGRHRASPCEGILEGSGILGNALLAVARGLREFCSASLQLRSSNSAITRSQAQENVHPAPARRPTCTFVSGLPAQKSDQVVIEAQHAPPPRPGLALPLVLRCPARPSRSRRSPGLCPPGGPGHGGGSACGRAARADPAPRLELGAPRSRRSVGRCGSRRITAGPLGGCVASRSGCGQSGRLGPRESVRRQRGASLARHGGGDPAAVVRLSAAAPLSAPGLFAPFTDEESRSGGAGARCVPGISRCPPAAAALPSTVRPHPARLAAFSHVLFRRCPGALRAALPERRPKFEAVLP